MNSFRRNDLLKMSAEQLASCDCVKQVQVIWSDQEYEHPSLEFFTEEARPKMMFEVHDTNSLNHRFNITAPVETDAIYSTDDDLEISCEDLQFAFEAWQMQPTTMVGFTPRLVIPNPETSNLTYHRPVEVIRQNSYNVILTKCCFLHKDHLRTYMEQVPRHVLAYIDEHRNCEDVLMSVIVAKYSQKAPLWVTARVKELAGEGISSLAHHLGARGECADFFAKELGGIFLVQTSARIHRGPLHKDHFRSTNGGSVGD